MNTKGKKEVKKTNGEKASKITKTLEEKDFQLSDKEKELISSLFSWSRQSEETNWVLGQPV
jgi:hypothetical protein